MPLIPGGTRAFSLTQVLMTLNDRTNDDVAYDPEEIVNQYLAANETLKVTPTYTLTQRAGQSAAWGPNAGAQPWGLFAWS